MACNHTSTSFDPVSRTVTCKDCGQVLARVKAKPGVKIMIPARRPKR